MCNGRCEIVQAHVLTDLVSIPAEDLDEEPIPARNVTTSQSAQPVTEEPHRDESAAGKESSEKETNKEMPKSQSAHSSLWGAVWGEDGEFLGPFVGAVMLLCVFRQ